MKHEKSLLSKILMTVVLPVALIFSAIAGIAMMVTSQNVDQFAGIQNSLILIYVIGLAVIVGVIMLGMKETSHRITSLAEAANRLADGDIEVGLRSDKPQDQVGEIAYALSLLADNSKTQSEIAQKLADGDLSKTIIPLSDKDLLGNNLVTAQKSMKKLLDYLVMMPELVEKKEYFDKNIEKNMTGDYKKALVQANQAMAAVSSNMEYYLSILDALPYRITTIDKDMNMVFVNKILEDLMKMTGTANQREEIRGVPCNSCNLEMCHTEDCGVKALKAGGDRLNELGYSEHSFEFRDRYYRMDTMNLINQQGEKIGYVDVSHDTTPVMSVNNYSEAEINRLADNLRRLSAGNLDFDLNIQEPGGYTSEVFEQFRAIETNLREVKDSIDRLVGDAIILTTAAMQGDLDVRADETKFSGSWQELISGMNGILGVMARPMEEVANVMAAIANGNLDATVDGYYQGSFDVLKQAVNEMGSNFKTIVTEISTVTREISNGNLNLENVSAFGGDFNA
ncbi:MAG: methyl-accepting chemotaxis protein, partial [Firmicutes bacterium HGW-Firmicutes-17]